MTETVDFTYVCQTKEELECARTCVTVEQCNLCHCATIEKDASGDWGDFMDVVFGLLPIITLLVVTVKKNPWPTTQSLPFAAAMMFAIRTMYFGSDPLLASGCVIKGLHEAWTPLSIMAGAIFLFETMESTYCMPYMIREMKVLTQGHPVAEGMILFSFATMVEGASGFGTPAALGTPMLVSMGHPALQSVVMLLVFNTFATVWGAVGTPIWFGYGSLGLSEDDLKEVGNRASIAMTIAAFMLLPWALTILMPWSVIRRNFLFVILAIAGTVLPSLGLSFTSYEFPSLLGGVVGCFVTGMLSQFKIGLTPLSEEDNQAWMERREQMAAEASEKASSATNNQESGDINIANDKDMAGDNGDDVKIIEGGSSENESEDRENSNSDDPEAANDNKTVDGSRLTEAAIAEKKRRAAEAAAEEHLGARKPFGAEYMTEAVLRTLPIWGVVLLLIITRIEEIGIKEHLVDKEPNFEIVLGSWGIFRLSRSLVFQLNHILTYPNLNWKYELLYIPFFMPFIVISFFTFIIYRQGARSSPIQIAKTTIARLRNPAVALLGALVLVQLMIRSGTAAPAFIIGTNLADWFKEGFVIICPLIGALGSFFSGSTTVSNLTFGGIQLIAAESIGVSDTAMLALQAIGGSAGNGICLNNIIAACAVVGLKVGEGEILARTARFVFSLTSIATVVMLVLYFRF